MGSEMCIRDSTRVENGYVKWNFGFGLIAKSVPTAKIVANQVVRNKAWWGVGIRFIPQGFLYNVSGLSAVELTLDDGKRIRIGSDEPDQFNRAIDRARGLLVDE